LVIAVSCGSKTPTNEELSSADPVESPVVAPDTSVAATGKPSANLRPLHSDNPDVQVLYDLITNATSPSSDGQESIQTDPGLLTEMLGSTEYVDTPEGQRVWVIGASCASVKAGLAASGVCGVDKALTFTDGSHEGALWVHDLAGPVAVVLSGK
jgi:hypothetical protein